MNAESRFGATGLVLVVVGAALVAVGFSLAVVALKVLAIGVLVLGLAALRARAWIRKTRVLTQVGRDLHVDRDDAD